MAAVVRPLAAVALALTLSGCLSIKNPSTAIPSPTATRRAPAPASTPTSSDPVPAPERGGTIPSPARRAQSQLTANAGAGSPRAALLRYATLWSTWTAGTVVADQRRLAGMSLGQARAQALQAAASFEHDTTLSKSAVANTGQVIAITPGIDAAGGLWVVVTRERTTGAGDYAGLPTTLHVTYAQLTHTQHGYVVTRWSPQN